VDHLCQLIIEVLRPGIQWNIGVGKIIAATHTLIEVAGPNNAFIANPAREAPPPPSTADPRRGKRACAAVMCEVLCAIAHPLSLARSEPSTLVKLLQRLFNAMSVHPETLARQEEYEHEWIKGMHWPSSQWLSRLELTPLCLFVCARARARGRQGPGDETADLERVAALVEPPGTLLER
jgi:hypothetical protein